MSTTQIAVRIPDDLLDYVDKLVADGDAKNRAAFVIAALKHERQLREDEREIEILKRVAHKPDPELEEFNAWAWQNAAQAWADLD
jgi:metal-responsive CopG/Arc/MetJ family transcriptional regulator